MCTSCINTMPGWTCDACGAVAPESGRCEGGRCLCALANWKVICCMNSSYGKDLLHQRGRKPLGRHWVCTMPKGHAGAHIACRVEWHDLASWE